ncbi:hypothetical protein GC163_08400 [bacterium]|nr:hypothetical protein [bacterium]
MQTTVDELSQNVRILTDIVAQIREDLSWLTRNGVPHQPLHVLVHSIPKVSEAKPESVQLSVFAPPNPDPTVALTDDQQRSSVIDQLVEQLSVPLGELAQEQLNALLGIMDHAHREILTAIHSPSTASSKPKSKQGKESRQRSKLKPAPVEATDPPPSAGQLF